MSQASSCTTQSAKQTMADDKTVAKVRRKLEATSEIPRLEKTTGRDGRSRPATTSRAPSQKAGGIAGRTVTAEVDPAASAERRKQEYTADESEREAMTVKDATLREFDGHVLQLAQIINRAEPERLARTSVCDPSGAHAVNCRIRRPQSARLGARDLAIRPVPGRVLGKWPRIALGESASAFCSQPLFRVLRRL